MDGYNVDLLEDMEPMVFVPGGNPSRFNRRDDYKTYLYDGDDARVPTYVSDEDENWSDTSVSSHVGMPVLALKSGDFR